jgi:hypothetical protein
MEEVSEILSKERNNSDKPTEMDSKKESMLKPEFFQQNILQVSENILGKILVHKLSDGTVISGRIIETEGKN